MAVDDKYKMFHNYLHNELGISKADIKQWTKEAVTEVAKDYVNHQFKGLNMEKVVSSILTAGVAYGGDGLLKQSIVKAIADKIILYVKN